MRPGTTTLSNIMKYGRMDAGFHIARQRVRHIIDDLVDKAIDPKVMKDHLNALPFYALDPLKPLARGSLPRWDRSMASKLIDDYPYEAYALVKEQVGRAVEHHHEKVREVDTEMKALRRFL